MPRKKRKKPISPIFEPVAARKDGDAILTGNLTVKDARHLLRTEGGDLDASEVVIQVLQIMAVGVACAYAIGAGHATVWHLALPMVGEYFALLVVMPILYVVLRHEAMRKDVIGSLWLWAAIATLVAISVGVSAHRTGNPWQEQFWLGVGASWRWIADHHMHWAILCAVAGVLL